MSALTLSEPLAPHEGETLFDSPCRASADEWSAFALDAKGEIMGTVGDGDDRPEQRFAYLGA